MKRAFTIHHLAMIALVFLLSIAVRGNQKLTATELMAKIDSLELLYQYDLACNLTDEFLSRFALSQETDKVLLSRAYLTKTYCMRDEGKHRESAPLLEEALRLSLLTTDSALIADCYREIGFACAVAGNYEKSLEVYTTAMQISSRMDDLSSVAIDLNAIGKIYEMWKQFDKALEFFFQSLEIARKQENFNQVAVRKASIASIYKSQQKYDLALEWLEKSLNLEIQLGNEVRRGYRLDQMGEIFTLTGQLEKAERYLEEALQIFRDKKVLTSESIALNHIAVNYMRRNNPTRAISFHLQSLDVANKTNFDNMKQKNHRELSMIYEQTANFDAALNHYKSYVELKDTAFSEKARQQMLDFQVKYETEQKEKELALLNQEKLEQELKLNQAQQQRIIMAGVSIILLILLTAVYGRFRIKKLTSARLASANEQLSMLNQTKNKFFTILAHDLKNPIYAFRNISAAVHDNLNDLSPQDLNYYTHELKSSSTRLCSFLDELLKWAGSLTGRLRPDPKTISIKPVLEELVGLHNAMADNKQISFNLSIDEHHTCFADHNMVHTVFRNLISNAIKFTPESGKISICSHSNHNYMEVCVTDTGVGMSEEDVMKLFKLGHDPSKIGNSAEKGMGMGLILCKEFVEKNNGKISVVSQVGVGSTFTVSLPIYSNN
jgi:signal transduction histidine kinase